MVIHTHAHTHIHKQDRREVTLNKKYLVSYPKKCFEKICL